MINMSTHLTVITIVLLIKSGLCHAEDKSKIRVQQCNSPKWCFDDIPIGKLPAGVQVFSGEWSVRSEQGAPSAPKALCQSGVAFYPAIVLGDRIYSDVKICTNIKPISGKEEQSAGIIFRVQDKNNYYILRVNALEDNVKIFKYVKGWRKLLKEGSVMVPIGVWQHLCVDVKDDLIRGYLNGELVVEATDTTFVSGKVGLWTKTDSQTCFDNVKIKPY